MSFTTPPTVVAGQKITATQGNKYAAAITELQGLSANSEAGPDSAGPTSGTTLLVVNTITIPAPGVAGRVIVFGQMFYAKTVGTDVFQVRVRVNGTGVGALRDEGAHTTASLCPVGATTVNGLSTITLEQTIERISGTGTATVSVGTFSTLQAIFVPAP